MTSLKAFALYSRTVMIVEYLLTTRGLIGNECIADISYRQ